MKSFTTPGFRKLFAKLPSEIRDQARSAYRLFRASPRHPSLNFKHVHGSTRLVSARVGLHYRVVGTEQSSGEIVWFWIGPHEAYEKLIYQL